MNFKNSISIEELRPLIQYATGVIAPVWPLEDYVAVNPFVGQTAQQFLEVRNQTRAIRPAEMLMPASYYIEQFDRGLVSAEDRSAALKQCLSEYPDIYERSTIEELDSTLEHAAQSPLLPSSERSIWTIAESIDGDGQSEWSSLIVNELSRHCSAHFDRGQSIWASPFRSQELFAAWKKIAAIDLRMERFGVAGFRSLVASLPSDPVEAIAKLLSEIELPSDRLSDFLICQLQSIAGWSALVRYRVRASEMSGQSNNELIGLLAMRLTYDIGLVKAGFFDGRRQLCTTERFAAIDHQTTAARYFGQVASEAAFRRNVIGKLRATANEKSNVETVSTRKLAQMVFCIDVRSEIIRRSLESVSSRIATYGFAGFFGLALEYVPLGEKTGAAQCPVLLKPAFSIHEKVRQADGSIDASINSGFEQERLIVRARRQLWKLFQYSAVSSFSFVESIGLSYFASLLRDTFGYSTDRTITSLDGVPTSQQDRLGPAIHACEHGGLATNQQIEMAQAILRNLGLTNEFASLVVMCGHASQTVNNPYRAGLDCGACGGHSGQSNARVAAGILNNPHVRAGLLQRGIEIPADTWFLAAVHNTTIDEIDFFDVELMPESLQAAFDQLQSDTRQAGRLTRIERGTRLREANESKIANRSRDWSEVRPEWGLAGNAAFIVAPRERTLGAKLDGRTFMHSYDFRQDKEFKVLELIMTAPMVVTNWINLQYYASTVDNRAFGSGNKTIHNVVGQLGVLQGNGGDLMTGLPWQSVHDGVKFQHEPLRLTVLIEAPIEAIDQIVAKHQLVADLVNNGWLYLMAIEDEQELIYVPGTGWTEYDAVATLENEEFDALTV